MQQPLLAAILFVGLIYVFLIPPVHFRAMIDPRLYAIMNWSMIGDGLLFWFLVLDPRPKPEAGTSYGTRMVLPFAVMFPQIALGSYIAFSPGGLYPYYDLCGRLFPSITAANDQHIGGIVAWIPAGMMSIDRLHDRAERIARARGQPASRRNRTMTRTAQPASWSMRRPGPGAVSALALVRSGSARPPLIAAAAPAVIDSHPWIRFLTPQIPAAGYFTLRNDSAQPVTLTAAASPDCGQLMLHRSVSENGTARMEMVTEHCRAGARRGELQPRRLPPDVHVRHIRGHPRPDRSRVARVRRWVVAVRELPGLRRQGQIVRHRQHHTIRSIRSSRPGELCCAISVRRSCVVPLISGFCVAIDDISRRDLPS